MTGACFGKYRSSVLQEGALVASQSISTPSVVSQLLQEPGEPWKGQFAQSRTIYPTKCMYRVVHYGTNLCHYYFGHCRHIALHIWTQPRTKAVCFWWGYTCSEHGYWIRPFRWDMSQWLSVPSRFRGHIFCEEPQVTGWRTPSDLGETVRISLVWHKSCDGWGVRKLPKVQCSQTVGSSGHNQWHTFRHLSFFP